MKKQVIPAFTLIECLIGLMILSSLLLTFNLLIQQTIQVSEFLQRKDQKEWLIFLAQLEEELKSSHNVSVKNQQLHYTIEDKQYIIERYQAMIRKRRTSGGHQPMLTSITELNYWKKNTQFLFMYTLKMEKMDMPYGQKTISRKCYKGSILFSVLLLFLLCTFLLMAALESYRLSMDLNIRIKNYYIAKIMKQMALSEQSTLAESSEGVFYYTTGSVTYQWVQQSLFLEVEVSPFIFRFTEEVKNDTDTSTE